MDPAFINLPLAFFRFDLSGYDPNKLLGGATIFPEVFFIPFHLFLGLGILARFFGKILYRQGAYIFLGMFDLGVFGMFFKRLFQLQKKCLEDCIGRKLRNWFLY